METEEAGRPTGAQAGRAAITAHTKARKIPILFGCQASNLAPLPLSGRLAYLGDELAGVVLGHHRLQRFLQQRARQQAEEKETGMMWTVENRNSVRDEGSKTCGTRH